MPEPMVIKVEGLTITDNGSYIDIEDDFRARTGCCKPSIRIGKKQAYGLLRAFYAVCDKSVGEIEAEIHAE